jgi:curved DNA-binding protein CbpA
VLYPPASPPLHDVACVADWSRRRPLGRLALKFHPDKGGCERVFKVISEAHDTLADPAKRSAYEADFRMSAEERAQRQRHPFGRGRGFSTGFGMAEEFEEMMHEEMCFQEMMYMRQMFGGGGGGRQGGFRGRGGGGFPFGFGGSPFDGGAHFGFDDSDEDYRSDSDEESGGAFYFGRGGGGGRAPPHRSAQQQQQPRAGTSGSRGSARSSSGARAKASKKNRKKKKR